VVSSSHIKNGLVLSDQDEATLYFSFLGLYAKEIKESGKGIVFLGENFVFGLLADPKVINTEELKKLTGVDVKTKTDIKCSNPETKEKIDVKGILQFSAIGKFNPKDVQEYLLSHEFLKTDL